MRTTHRNMGKAHLLARCKFSTAQEMAGLCFLMNLFISPPLSKEDLIYSMCFACGPSPEKLASPFCVYFLSLNQFCSFVFVCLFTYIMIKHSLGSLGSISGWQRGVQPPPSSSLSLELWGRCEILGSGSIGIFNLWTQHIHLWNDKSTTYFIAFL